MLCAPPLQFISCYPEEREETFPPLTLMKPVKRPPSVKPRLGVLQRWLGGLPMPCESATEISETVTVGDLKFTVVKMYLTASDQ